VSDKEECTKWNYYLENEMMLEFIFVNHL